MSPSIVCIDTWQLPNIYFEKNSININENFNPLFSDTLTLLPVDSIFKHWVWNLLNNLSANNRKIEIASYSDYDENDSISTQRLNYFYDKLITSGLSKERLLKSNYNKANYNYYKFRDGCFPFYILEKQPILIDKKYIDALTDVNEIEYAKQLRRVITFNWK